MSKKLVCIYNANSGLLQGALDSLHKFVSPSTYDCALCSLTYGYMGQKKQRSEWLNKQDIDFIFLHKDELPYRDYHVVGLPCILLDGDGIISQVVSSQDFTTFKTIEDLIFCLDRIMIDISDT